MTILMRANGDLVEAPTPNPLKIEDTPNPQMPGHALKPKPIHLESQEFSVPTQSLQLKRAKTGQTLLSMAEEERACRFWAHRHYVGVILGSL